MWVIERQDKRLLGDRKWFLSVGNVYCVDSGSEKHYLEHIIHELHIIYEVVHVESFLLVWSVTYR